MNNIEMENITFGQWLTIWFDTYKKPVLKAYSVRNIEQMIRLHTPDWLKLKCMREITLFDIDKALMSIPLGRTRVYARQVWNSAFLKAEKHGIISRNVVSLTDRISYRKKKSNALTVKEQKDFLERLELSKYKFLFLFYLFSGVRRTEALTLVWSDVDFDNRTIQIKGTKTESSSRRIVLTNDLERILEERKKQAKKENCKSPFVFPYSKEHVSRKFKELCPNHHLHDLRHTYVTRCAECGVNINVCQQLVGHSTADMTMNVYTHVLDDFKRKEILKFSIFPHY